MENSELLERLRQGDNALLTELYDLHRAEFISWARKFGTNNSEAEEIFQESVIALYENALSGKLPSLSSSLKTYLFGIGKNKCKEDRRNRKKAALQIDPKWLELFAGEVDTLSEIKYDVPLLRRALKLLGDPCRILLELMYFEGLSQDEISMIMDYKSRNTVKSKKYKCIARLKKILENPLRYETDITKTHK